MTELDPPPRYDTDYFEAMRWIEHGEEGVPPQEYPEPWPEIFDLEAHPIPGYEDWCDRVTDVLRIMAVEIDNLRRTHDPSAS